MGTFSFLALIVGILGIYYSGIIDFQKWGNGAEKEAPKFLSDEEVNEGACLTNVKPIDALPIFTALVRTPINNVHPVKNVSWTLMEIPCPFVSKIEGSLIQIHTEFHDDSMPFIQV